MTDIVEEARALLAQVKDDLYPFDCDEPRDDAKRLLAALADECERLRAENARLREAMPTDEESDFLRRSLPSYGSERNLAVLDRLDAAKEVGE